jgi:hypothetical protein
MKVMGQDMNECVAVLEEWVGAVTDEEWLLTSPNGKYNPSCSIGIPTLINPCSRRRKGLCVHSENLPSRTHARLSQRDVLRQLLP